MNPFSFNGRSGSLNFFVYGLLPAFIIFMLGYYISHPVVIVVLLVLGVVLLLAAVVRRGRDAGMSVGNTIGFYILSSWIISTVMDMTFMSLRLVFMFKNPIIGTVLVVLITNIFLVYLLFAPKSDKEVPKAKTSTKVVLGLLGIVMAGVMITPIVASLSK